MEKVSKLSLFSKNVVSNVSMPVIGGKQVETIGGSINTCEGDNYIYAKDVKHSNWIFADTVTYTWIDGHP